MTRSNFTDINILLDVSGSMKGKLREAEQSLMSFINEQKKVPGYAELSYYVFSDARIPRVKYEISYDVFSDARMPRVRYERGEDVAYTNCNLFGTEDITSNLITKMESIPISDIHELPLSDPLCLTALLDAMGNLINKMGKRYARMEEKDRPDKVIMVIMTDGLENSSIKFNNQQIADMVKHQEDVYNWDIIYLGANQDAIAEASKFGISPLRSMTYSQEKYKETMHNLSCSVKMSRENKISKTDDYFKKETREEVI